MTCIAGVVHDGRTFIGGDACGSSEASWQDVGNVKVFALGELLIGVCGSFRLIDLLRYAVPCVRANDEPLDRFLRATWVGALWDVLDRHKLIVEGCFDGGALVGIGGRLFELQSDFSIINAPEWGLAVGSGEAAARGSLHTTSGGKLKPRERVLAALRAAEAVAPSVRGPFAILESRKVPA